MKQCHIINQKNYLFWVRGYGCPYVLIYVHIWDPAFIACTVYTYVSSVKASSLVRKNYVYLFCLGLKTQLSWLATTCLFLLIGQVQYVYVREQGLMDSQGHVVMWSCGHVVMWYYIPRCLTKPTAWSQHWFESNPTCRVTLLDSSFFSSYFRVLQWEGYRTVCHYI